MKPWPANDKPADFDDMVKPFVRALRFAYKMHRQNQDNDIPYTGFNHNVNHICFPIDQKLTAEQLAYDKDEQGRDALEVIIGAILQVGCEQGRRIAMESSEVKMLRTQAQIAEILMKQQKPVD